MAVLILEPSSNGHRFHYLAWSVRAYLSDGRKVVVGINSNDAQHPFISDLQLEYPDRLKLITLDHQSSALWFPAREINLWRWFRQIFKQYPVAQIDEVFVPYLDHFLYAIPLLGSPFGETEFSGIVMTQSFHQADFDLIRPPSRKDFIEKHLFSRSQKNPNLKRLLSIDPYLKDSRYATDKVEHIPDPAELPSAVEQVEAQNSLQLDEHRKYILVFGSLALRKGIANLLASVIKHNLEVTVCLIGRHDGDTIKLLGQPSSKNLIETGRLLSKNRFIPVEEETLWYSAADAIWLGYQQHYGSSGNLIKAAMFDKPVIACREGLIGKQAIGHELGLTCDTESADDIAATIAKLPEFVLNRNDQAAQAFARAHDVTSFYRVIVGGQR